MRNATPSTVNIFRRELANFKNLDERDRNNMIKKTLTVVYEDKDIVQDVIGIINSKIYTIIIKLEECNIIVDPDNKWAMSTTGATFDIYLNEDTSMWKNILIGLSNYIKMEINVTDNFYLF